MNRAFMFFFLKMIFSFVRIISTLNWIMFRMFLFTEDNLLAFAPTSHGQRQSQNEWTILSERARALGVSQRKQTRTKIQWNYNNDQRKPNYMSVSVSTFQPVRIFKRLALTHANGRKEAHRRFLSATASSKNERTNEKERTGKNSKRFNWK